MEWSKVSQGSLGGAVSLAAGSVFVLGDADDEIPVTKLSKDAELARVLTSSVVDFKNHLLLRCENEGARLGSRDDGTKARAVGALVRATNTAADENFMVYGLENCSGEVFPFLYCLPMSLVEIRFKVRSESALVDVGPSDVIGEGQSPSFDHCAAAIMSR